MALAVILITVVIVMTVVWQLVIPRIIDMEALNAHQGLVEAMLGVVGTMFSVLLGVLVAGAIDSYHDIRGQVNNEANGLADVFRLARGLDDVDRPRIRGLCREYCNYVIDDEWKLMKTQSFSTKAQDAYQRLWEAVVSVAPQDDRQNNLHQSLLNGMQSLGENRRVREVSCNTTLSPILWVAVIFGAVITTAFTHFFSSKLGAAHTMMTTLIAVSLGLNVWLLAEYSAPFSGALQIEPEMFLLLREQTFKSPDTPPRFFNAATEKFVRSK